MRERKFFVAPIGIIVIILGILIIWQLFPMISVTQRENIYPSEMAVASPMVTLEVPTDVWDTIVHFSSGEDPKILEVENADVEGETTAQIIRLKIKNVGKGEDTFMISSISFGGDPIYLASSSRISLEPGEVGWLELEVSTSSFEAEGTYDASVKVQAIGSGKESETFTWSGKMIPHEEAAEEEAYADVTILVLDPDGKPVQGATVVLPGYGSQQTLKDGTVSWSNVAVGDYRVQVSHYEFGRTSKVITVTSQGAFVTIQFGGGGDLIERNKTLLAMGALGGIGAITVAVLYTRKKRGFARERR